MRHSSRILYAALPAFLLAACGGGGGGEVASTPLPPPAIAGSRVRAQVSSPVTPTKTFTSMAASVGRTVNSSGSFGPYVGALAGRDQSVIGIDSPGGYATGYTITLPLYSQTANGPQIVDRRIDFSSNTLFFEGSYALGYKTLQSPASTAANYDSLLYINYLHDGRNPQDLGLEHVSFGELQTCNTATGTGCSIESAFYGGAYFVYGDATPAGDIPLSGTASYSGGLNGFSNLTGDAALSVNFASQSISGAFTNMKYEAGENGSAPIPDLGLSGKLDMGGAISGTLTSGSNSAARAGQWNAAFFGPEASEIGGAFLIEDIGGTPFPGVFGLRKK